MPLASQYSEGLPSCLRFALPLCLVILLNGCAGLGDEPDPLESYNRSMHRVNQTLDSYLLRPVARFYVDVTPEAIETGIANFYDNLGYPLVTVNQFLQGKGRLGLQDAARFLINSTLGLAGFIDVATPMGLTAHSEDFGQTLATWGANSGPYIVLPLWGPSTLRDLTGDGIHLYTTYVPPYIEDVTIRNSIVGFSYIDTRAGLFENEQMLGGGDEYLFLRDAYLQRREFLILDGQNETDPFLE